MRGPSPMRRWSDRNRGKIVFIVFALILILVSGTSYLFRDIFIPAEDVSGTISLMIKMHMRRRDRKSVKS